MSWYKDWLFYTLVIGVFVFDQVTKAIIRSSLSLGDSWPEEGIFRIVHGLNTGSAFGLFAGFTNLLVVASIIGIVFILFVFTSVVTSVFTSVISAVGFSLSTTIPTDRCDSSCQKNQQSCMQETKLPR